MSENIEYYRNQVSLARTEIKNLRQQLSSLKNEHLKEIKQIKSTLSGLKCANCANKPTVLEPIQNTRATDTQPSTSVSGNNVSFKPIGHIETTFQNKRGVPRQPSVMGKAKGTVVIDQTVFNNPQHALSGLEEFSHMWIIFHFHATESNSVPAKVSPPRLGGERRGVLSTRSPHRPCPIGLSLVHVQAIEDNKIHFLGVDMVNGTPVLDVKPYIPHYDYPAFTDALATRPPTEGINDVTDMAALQVDDDAYDLRSISPHLPNAVGIDTSPIVGSPYKGEIPLPLDSLTPTQPSPNSPSVEPSPPDISPRRPDTERGAPDGQERFTPPSSNQNVPQDGIRIAPWISSPPVYEVRFTDDVNARINELIGERAVAFKNNIQSLLSEDPRSNYVRNRYPDHEYSCVLEDLSISCIFEADTSMCTIVAVRSAEEMQNS